MANFIEKLKDFQVLNLDNFSELMRAPAVAGFHKIAEPIPFEEYLKTELTEDKKQELKFAPKVEVVKFRDPAGDNFTGFRSVLKNGVLIFTLLPGDLLPICAEFRHGCERVMLNLPAGLIEPNDASPETAAKREFEEETGITLQELIPLNSKGIPIDARILTRENFFFLGIPAEPLEIKKQKLHKAEFVQRFLIKINDWLSLMEFGLVDGCSMTGTILALKKLNLVRPPS